MPLIICRYEREIHEKKKEEMMGSGKINTPEHGGSIVAKDKMTEKK